MKGIAVSIRTSKCFKMYVLPPWTSQIVHKIKYVHKTIYPLQTLLSPILNNYLKAYDISLLWIQFENNGPEILNK